MSLFALAFATDLCHGLKPADQKYHQDMCATLYDSISNTKKSSLSRGLQKIFLFSVSADYQMIEQNMFSVIHVDITLHVLTHFTGQLTPKEDGDATNKRKYTSVSTTKRNKPVLI